MGMNVAQKLINRHLVSGTMTTGEEIGLKIDQTLTQDAETKNWSKPKKSTDLIDWENVFRFPLEKLIDPYAAFRLESQFLDASVNSKNLYLNPMKLTESIGIARKLYDNDKNFVLTRLGFGRPPRRLRLPRVRHSCLKGRPLPQWSVG